MNEKMGEKNVIILRAANSFTGNNALLQRNF